MTDTRCFGIFFSLQVSRVYREVSVRLPGSLVLSGASASLLATIYPKHLSLFILIICATPINHIDWRRTLFFLLSWSDTLNIHISIVISAFSMRFTLDDFIAHVSLPYVMHFLTRADYTFPFTLKGVIALEVRKGESSRNLSQALWILAVSAAVSPLTSNMFPR